MCIRDSQALLDNKAIIDFGNKKLYFIRAGEANIDLPSGSSTFQLEQAPSGHLVLPCAHYGAADNQRRQLDQAEVALHQASSPIDPASPSASPTRDRSRDR